jgi:hypothetical protein
MQFRILAAALALAVCAALAHAQSPLRLQISGGRVTLHAQNVPVRTILAEWARIGGAQIVNGDRVAGAPVTLDLEGVPERQALEIILRGVSGYVVAAREPGASGASMYDRIMILPTSVAPRNPAPAAAVLQAPGGLRPVVPRQAAEEQNDGDGDAGGITGNDGVPLGRPVPVPTQIPGSRPAAGGVPFNPAVQPPVVLPDSNPPQTQQPPPVVGTPGNPFGLPAGSSLRPGVITPPPQPPPQGATPRSQE